MAINAYGNDVVEKTSSIQGDNIKVEEGGKTNRDELIGYRENYRKYMFIHCSFI